MSGLPNGAFIPDSSTPKPTGISEQELSDDDDQVLTEASQGEFVGPEYEFDQFETELEATPDDELDGDLAAGQMTPDGFVEEDFETELGTCAAQELSVQDTLDLEYKDVSRLGVIQVAGDDRLGRKVIVFSACRLPVVGKVDLQRLYDYMKKTLEQYVVMDYSLVYLHHGFTSQNQPPIKWLIQAYRGFDRNFKKNLKALYLVHPTNIVLLILKLFRPIISRKFGQKINLITKLSELSKDMHIDQLPIPQRVRLHDARIVQAYEASINSGDPYASYVANRSGFSSDVPNVCAPLAKPYKPQQVFGVSLQHIAENNGGDPIPKVLLDCVDYIQRNSLDSVGIFRRSARTIHIKTVQDIYNEGGSVQFDSFDDFNLPAVLVKTFFRELEEPVLTYDIYDDVLRIHNLTPSLKIETARTLISERLPEINYKLLKFLMEFLQEVSAHMEMNRMTDFNLGIVFGPNLLWSRYANIFSFSAAGQINSFVELLISNYHDIFIK